MDWSFTRDGVQGKIGHMESPYPPARVGKLYRVTTERDK